MIINILKTQVETMSSMNRENQVLTNSTKNNNSNFVQPKTFVKRPSNNRNRDFNVPTNKSISIPGEQ